MNKRLIVLALGALALAGCGDDNADNQQSAASATPASAPEQHKPDGQVPGDSVDQQEGPRSGPPPGQDGRRGGGKPDKSSDAGLAELIKTVPQRFQTLSFSDPENGNLMEYKLFVPDNYDSNQQYPLVLFMPDASTVGAGVDYALTQGWGGMIWATEESQKKHPAFVLVPYFKGPEWAVSGKSTTTSEVDTALRLFNSVVGQYSIDRNRLYTTGQSMGGMISFYFNSIQPDLFAASLFVGSQWDISVLKPLEKAKFFYIVSAGDPGGSGGMKEVGEMLKQDAVDFGEVQFSARLPEAEQQAQVQALLDQGHAINFVRFDAGSVIPEGVDGGRAGDHMYSFDYAYKLDNVRDWLFAQSKAAQ